MSKVKDAMVVKEGSKVNGKAKTLKKREAKEQTSVARFRATEVNAKAVAKEEVMTKAKVPVAKVKVRTKNAQVLYEKRQAFVVKNGEAIAAEWVKQGEKASWAKIIPALKLNHLLIGYALVKLGLLVTKNRHALSLIAADEQFNKTKEKQDNEN